VSELCRGAGFFFAQEIMFWVLKACFKKERKTRG